MNGETEYDMAELMLKLAEYVRMTKSIATDRIKPSDAIIAWAKGVVDSPIPGTTEEDLERATHLMSQKDLND